MGSGIKLIIWDLDGILWSESLSETGSTGSINQEVVSFIKETEHNGILHSVCSKNDYNLAVYKLKELQIFDLFIFPVIEYAPKGPKIKYIIENCQLREENVLFVDDNTINLNEARYYNTNIHVENSTQFIKNFKVPKGKSRTNQYKILEYKNKDKNNSNFLRDSNINICIVNKDLPILFFQRIEELVNRSNQLNLTKTRFADYSNTITPFYEIDNRDNFVVFVWDKYGYYGLVGYFASTREDYKVIDRFVFSCRILNMGIEDYCKNYLLDRGYILPKCLTNTVDTGYIKLNEYKDVENFINEKENLLKIYSHKTAKIYAGCLSYSLWALSTAYNHMLYAEFGSIESYFSENEFVNSPKILIVSLLNELNTNCTGVDPHYLKKTYTNFINQCLVYKKVLVLLIPKNINNVIWDNEQTKIIITDLYNFWNNQPFQKIYTPSDTQYAHLTRIEQYEVSQQISNFVLSNLE